MKIEDWLIARLNNSLLGEIYSSIRAICVKYAENKELTIRTYIDREVLDFDYECLEVVSTNLASMVSRELINRIELECFFEQGPIASLNPLDGFIYCRREYDLPKEI